MKKRLRRRVRLIGIFSPSLSPVRLGPPHSGLWPKIWRLMDYLLTRYKPVAPFLQLANNLRKSLNNVLPRISNLNISPLVKQNDVLMLFPLQRFSDNLFNNSFGRGTLVVIPRAWFAHKNPPATYARQTETSRGPRGAYVPGSEALPRILLRLTVVCVHAQMEGRARLAHAPLQTRRCS